MRGSDPDAALYYLAAMLEAGEDPRFIARRMIVHRLRGHRQRRPAGARSSPSRRRRPLEHVGLPEAQLNLAQAAIYLARAPKSNAVVTALGAAQRGRRASTALSGRRRRSATPTTPAPRSSATERATSIRRTTRAGYEVDYLPEELKGRTYYEPSGAGKRRTTDPPDGSARRVRGCGRRARSRRARRRGRPSRSPGRGSGSPRRSRASRAAPDSATSSIARCASR